MITEIIPADVRDGTIADAFRIAIIADDCQTNAAIAYHFGNMVEGEFVPLPVAGTLYINGGTYTGWVGTNEQLASIVANMLGLQLA